MHRYKELKVWEKSIDLSIEIYELTRSFPSEEKFGMISQMRRSGVSVPSNIAEGAGRNTDGEFINFLGIAEGSINELESQTIISGRLNFLTNNEVSDIENKVTEIKNMLFSLKRSLGFGS
jgi:four helix bundle protein